MADTYYVWVIPNVFVSSTISDLHYLRDGIRDAIGEISYNPVMSEHGDIGYIHNGRADQACYVAMRQCHIAIVIVGKRYGSIMEGISVTHKEFRTAKENEIPLITFVDADVMGFKKVYDAHPTADLWDKFDEMEGAHNIFALINEITSSDIYNGIIEFRSASDAKNLLKKQLAHFVGDRLTEIFRPVKSDVHEILAEVKALRKQLAEDPKNKEGKPTNDAYYIALRFLLEERNKDYTKFVEVLFGDLDLAASGIQNAESIPELIKIAGGIFQTPTHEELTHEDWMQRLSTDMGGFSSHGAFGAWGVSTQKEVWMTSRMLKRLDERQKVLLARLGKGRATAKQRTLIEIGPNSVTADDHIPDR